MAPDPARRSTTCAGSGLRRRTLAALDEAVAAGGGPEGLDDVERRCARLLRERLEAAQALYEAGEELRSLGTLFSPVQNVRGVFNLMPTSTAEDWQTIAARLGHVPEALDSYRATLAEGVAQGVTAGPRQVEAVLEQLGEWLGA